MNFKKLLSVIVFSSFAMIQADPFSGKEIQSLADFELTKPEFLTASDGCKLAYYSFANSRSNQIVILYAGAGLYGNKTYQWVAKTLHEEYGIGCYIFDIRGHGHSQGDRGDGPSIQQVVHDVSTAVEFVKKEHKNAKIYLTGHSSGAGLIINYLNQEKSSHVIPGFERESKTLDLVKGYIFIAPYLGPQSGTLKNQINPNDNFVKSVRTWVYILGSMFPSSWFIHWNAVWFNYSKQMLKDDPLIVSVYTYVMSMATTPYEINDLIQKIDKPTALFVGSDDEQFVAQKILEYAKMMKAPVFSQLVDGAKHLSILLESPKLIAEYLKKVE
jgi:alpha-beta hydrolase superfamily lysophospholipase